MSAASSGYTDTAILAVASRRSRVRRERAPRLLRGFAGIVVLLVLWELFSRIGVVDARFMPPPTAVLPRLAQLLALGDFWAAVGETLAAWGIGLMLAFLGAIVLGVLIGLSPFLRRATQSTVEFLRPIPSVGLIPLAVLLFGVEIEASLLLIVYAAFWQIFIQVLYGVADVDPIAMSTGRSYGFSLWHRIRDIVLPTMLPYLMTGVRLAAAVGLILAITAELLIGSPGLGIEISLAQNGGEYETMYALMIATGLLGVLINLAARIVERRLLSWHHSTRQEVPV